MTREVGVDVCHGGLFGFGGFSILPRRTFDVACRGSNPLPAPADCLALPDLLQGLRSRTVPFDQCPETTSLSATESPSGDSSTPSSSSDGELASGATF
jgi:hypothetical protein